MRDRVLTPRARVVAALAIVFLFSSVLANAVAASHWGMKGWYDRRYNYPAVPNGLAAINNVFGDRCTADSNFNRFTWRAADNGVAYNVNFHKKLGGAPTPGWYNGNGGGSTNLYYDVRGTFANRHIDTKVLSGIWGYNCRQIAGSTKWSTHAWGIAIDTNSAYEHLGHVHSHTVDAQMVGIYETHNWTWGLGFRDAMHFQYATGY